MTGYAFRTRPATEKAQDLWVKALAFEDPSGRRGVIITADLCGITRELSDQVAAELGKRFSLPRSAVMTNASHTHSSPWLEGNLMGLRLFSPEDMKRLVTYRLRVAVSMIAAATQALKALAPATLATGEGEATFGFNRRNNSATQVTALRAAGKLRGPNDDRVPILTVKNASGKLVAVLLSYACHNTTLSGYEWHGDYAGCAQAEIEKRHPGATALFATGCGADLNPFPRGEIAHAEAHGRALADTTDRVLAGTLRPISGRFASAMSDLPLTFSRTPTEEELRTQREKEQPFKEMYQAWSHVVEEDMRKRGPAVLDYAYPIQAWQLGSLTWVALGGEVVVDYALRFKKELGPDAWIFAYSTDVMAYIPNERILQEGRYEGDTSMIVYGKPAKWTAGLEDRIVTRTHELVKEVRAEK